MALRIMAYGRYGLPYLRSPNNTPSSAFSTTPTGASGAYIRAKERLIELLEEKKQAMIHQTVTGQVDVRTGEAYPVYKHSGVEWLGEVPEHWELSRVKGEVRVPQSVSSTTEQRRAREDDLAPI